MKNRNLYPKVASTLAVVLSMAGTSWAAIVVTGKSVKDNSLTTRDIRDRSLVKRDFRPGQLPTSEAVARYTPDSQVTLPGDDDALVKSASLPAGNWVVSASGVLDNEGANTIGGCVILEGSAVVVKTGSQSLDAGQQQSFAASGAIALDTPSELELRCTIFAGGIAEDASLTAIRVANLDQGE